MEDVNLGRKTKIKVSQVTVVSLTLAGFTPLVLGNPNRVHLRLGVDSGSGFIATDQTIGAGACAFLQAPFNHTEFDIKDDGMIVTFPFWGFGAAAPFQIYIIETLLDEPYQ